MSLGLKLCAAATVGAALLCAASAYASEKDCTGYDSLKDNPTIESGKVSSPDKRTNFIKSEMDDKSCPADGAACRRKAFLVPGNSILIGTHTGDFVCAIFANAKGVETDGWLPKSAVTVDAGGSVKPDDWYGTWVREEAKITLKDGGGGKLAVKGHATFGSEDPERVKSGTVNEGDISGTPAVAGDRASFAMGDNDKTMPVDKGDDSTCKVWMRRLGDYLLVDDNNTCGGMNVSFRGTYVRR